ncbi:hypothetical protein DICPUDRAFT_153103 [Dictyostelium purpureum]|uniref:Uncharacterized protein n=1 Tax=Dictyostelium purpureum TaxID=5786 RepID=F0ZN25_DICPU|nr:uncharacterized protein DICPUDRAFT_153103 [Dictyostelium purpureum]EGC34668.1 hypothetical protein DICPUDRAFT_153103 [Dictyostelium purpureum]|eukprot:XP_003288805.1 hypothetical protein DICPUDRAFT_153103 [Dictyostelium purpureum]
MENEIKNQQKELIQYHKIQSIKEQIKEMELNLLLFYKNGNMDKTSNSTITESIKSIKKCIIILEENNLLKKN